MANETTFDFLKIVPFLSLLATILGWVISSHLSGRNTSRHASNVELNRLIDSLYKGLDDIYNEMLVLVTVEQDEHKKTVSYHKFINMVQNIRFISSSINKLDSNQKSADTLIAELRQACTDDRKYSPTKIGVALPELRDIQERLKSNYNKKFA